MTGSTSKSKTDSTYASVTDQAGIYAGEGGFDIEVGGNTDLKGAVIASEADADKNRLSTDTLTYSDIENKAEYSASSTGISFNTRKNAEKKDVGITPNISGSDGQASSTTKSAITPGEIEIRSDKDKPAEEKTALNGLNRDTTSTPNSLDKIFDKAKVLEKQEAANLFGELAFTAIGDLATKNGWSDEQKIVAHGIVGGLMTEINGGNFGEGLTTAAINKLIINELTKLTDEKGERLVPDEALRTISAGVGALIDGNQGASIADSATANNWLSHEEMRQMMSELLQAEQEYGKESAQYKEILSFWLLKSGERESDEGGNNGSTPTDAVSHQDILTSVNKEVAFLYGIRDGVATGAANWVTVPAEVAAKIATTPPAEMTQAIYEFVSTVKIRELPTALQAEYHRIMAIEDPRTRGRELTEFAINAGSLAASGASVGAQALKLGKKLFKSGVNLAEDVGSTTAKGLDKAEKIVPNPYGKNGGPLHQGKIREVAENLQKQGYDVTFEKRVETPGGTKSVRYGDILATDPNTGEQWIIQVGKQTKAGNPIARESKAIKDLEDAGWKVEFEPYN